MTVSATGTGLSYQRYTGTSGNTTNAIGGAISNSYTTPPLFANKRYWVRVSNATASTDSNTALITVAFTDTPLVAGTVIKAVHINELRTRIDAIRVAHGLLAVTWPAMTPGVTPILASDILEMREALLDAYNAPPRDPPIYTTTPAPGAPVVVADVAELRTAVIAIECGARDPQPVALCRLAAFWLFPLGGVSGEDFRALLAFLIGQVDTAPPATGACAAVRLCLRTLISLQTLLHGHTRSARAGVRRGTLRPPKVSS